MINNGEPPRVAAYPFCGDESEFEACPVCEGFGTIHFSVAGFCTECSGSGHGWDSLPCEECMGDGVVEIPYMIEDCPDCHGTGRRPLRLEA